MNVYLRGADGSDAPSLESFCITQPAPGILRIRWSLGPTPEAALLVASGQNEEIVKSHDFWHIAVPEGLICSQKINFQELVFEREGGLDVRINGNNSEIRIYGVTASATFPGSKLPGFLTDGIGLDAFIVNEQDLFTAKLSLPFFDIPVTAVGDVGPDDPLSINLLGIRFKVH